jgi:hypothetical protein
MKDRTTTKDTKGTKETDKSICLYFVSFVSLVVKAFEGVGR